VLTVSLILVVSLAFNAPLEQPVNVMHPPTGQGALVFPGVAGVGQLFGFWGGIGIPGLMVAMLFLAPYIDRTPRRGPLVRQGAAAG